MQGLWGLIRLSMAVVMGHIVRSVKVTFKLLGFGFGGQFHFMFPVDISCKVVSMDSNDGWDTAGNIVGDVRIHGHLFC